MENSNIVTGQKNTIGSGSNNYISSLSNEKTYRSTILNGTSCTISGSYTSIVRGTNNYHNISNDPNYEIGGSSSVVRGHLSSIYNSVFPGSLNAPFSGPFQPILGGVAKTPKEKKKILLRYNHNRENDYDVWRVIIDGIESRVTKVHYYVPVETVVELDPITNSNKANILCYSDNLEFFNADIENKNHVILHIR